MDASARLAFNMKVLKRHDPAIEEIIDSISYVVLYSLEEEWTKTGTEGPMFLYRRSIAPQHGFFVLNRNGVENYSAHLAPEDDLEIANGFIIHRAVNAEDVVGIWIFEAEQRSEVGQQMLKLQRTPFSSDLPSTSSISKPLALTEAPVVKQGTSITLDALFSTGSTGTTSNPSSTTAAAPRASGLSLLDSIFDSASATLPPIISPPSTLQGADGLKAMLGLQNTSNSVPISDMKRQPFVKQASNGVKEHANPAAVDIVDASLQNRTKGPQFSEALSRRDFVREVLSLIHTDKDFVDDLYKRYQAR